MRYRNASIMHIIEADCWTTIGPRTRFFNFATLNALRSFLTRCQPEDATLAGFEQSVGAGQRVRPHPSATKANHKQKAPPDPASNTTPPS
jgi:hypothetical protein